MSQISTILFLSIFNFATGVYPMECCSNCIDKGRLSYRSPNTNYRLEVCVDSLSSAYVAAFSGADRLELCQGLDVGGLTPSIGFIRLAKRNIRTIPIFMVVRPRYGDFVYTKDEIEQMTVDMNNSLHFGIDGFVTGALRNDGKIDRESCDALIKAAGDKPVTFNRAFDLTHRDQDFFDIIDLGFKRILTNGRKNRASEGMPLIKKLVVQAANKVIIMPGPSISHLNVGNILHETKVVEVQSSGENPQSNTISEPYSIHILVVSPTVLGEEVKKIKATLNRYPLLYY